MHSVQTTLWDPRAPSRHAPPLPRPNPNPPNPNPNPRLAAHVTRVSPAKRITFYKSGDSQFGGVKMAVHRRSFKCFDALLDDLTQKVPLPFGVRTITTPRGTHAIRHLEQLQDGGCYVCSDRRRARPVDLELVRRHHHHHHGGVALRGCHDAPPRRPHRPESSSATPPTGHTAYRQRRVLLVKNSEPGLRRSVVLGRRSTRSLRAFLDEVSEVMQFHVRKLYTTEGRRIDSVQSLMTCPAVLVCVGREAFSPLLVNYIRKSSEEKLPGLGNRSPGLGPRTPGNGARSPATHGQRSPPHGAQSRGSEYSEGHGSKKNVNFGLETKRSIIHPRSDSSNRSTRFSLSSEKSYGNGVSSLSQNKQPSIMNEDIEKRVLVNKDGSLSVEMRVRFRLQNEETVQWSTQIKKSPSLTNCPLSEAQPHYLQQGQSESCSDPDSTTFDPEVVDYSGQPVQRVSEASHCPCCFQRPEQHYDLWENPAHSHKPPPVPPPHASSHTHHTMVRHTHSSSSSSSCNSRRVLHCRARLSNACAASSASEQGQVVQEEVCVTEQVERRLEVEQDGDTHVEVCSVSRSVASRPLSAVSNSSHVLQSLKEDQDDELPPSASRCCHSKEASPTGHHTPRDGGSRGSRGSRAMSAASSCHCGAATPHSMADLDEMDVVPRATSRLSRASCRSSRAKIRNPEEEEGAADDEDEEMNRAASGLSGCTRLSAGSQRSGASSVCLDCGGCKRGANSTSCSSSRASQRSCRSHRASPLPEQEDPGNGTEDEGSELSTQSNKSNLTNNGCASPMSNVPEERESEMLSRTVSPEVAGEEEEEERAQSAVSATSHRSKGSHKSACDGGTAAKEDERSPSAMSAQSKHSAKSHLSHKSNCSRKAEVPDDNNEEQAEERALSSLSARSGASSKASARLSVKAPSPAEHTAAEEDETNQSAPGALSVKSPDKEERSTSVLSAKSAKSNVSAKSGRSHKSTCSRCARGATPAAVVADEPTVTEAAQDEGSNEVEERPASAVSAKSNLSVKSKKSAVAPQRSPSPRAEEAGEGEDRSASQMSGRSVKSNRSSKSCKDNGVDVEQSPNVVEAEEKETEAVEEETQPERPESVTSARLESEERAASRASSKSRKSNRDENTRAKSERGDNTGDVEEEPAGRPTSAASAKSASPAKSPTRTPSALSGKSRTSAKSSKSHKSNCAAASPAQNEADATPAETNAEETQAESQERAGSAASAKSKCSQASHKSNPVKNLKAASPTPNIVTIETPEGVVDTEGNDTTERPQSAASAKSGKSRLSSSSRKSKSSKPTAVEVVETTEAKEKEVTEDDVAGGKPESSLGQTLSAGRARSPRTRSPKPPATPQQLLDPGVGDTRAPSALSVRSTASAKSGKSKCRCGASSALEKATVEKGEGEKEEEEEKKEAEEEKKEEEEEKKEDKEQTPERAASALSTSSKRRDSGGTEKPLSRNSSGSVSLGLPEDQDEADSDSGKSSVSFLRNTESKNRGKSGTLDVPQSAGRSAAKEDEEGTASNTSPMSNSNGGKSNLSHNHPALDIPTIETPGGTQDKGIIEGEEKDAERAASALSARSSRSHKSCASCRSKAASKTPEQNASPTSPTIEGNQLETGDIEPAPTNKRSSSALSTASAKVRSKSPGGVSVKKAPVANTAAKDSENTKAEKQADSRPASQAKGQEEKADNKAASIRSKSPCCLRPQSGASAKSGSKVKVSSDKTSNSGRKETGIKSPSPCPVHSSNTTGSGVESSETTLSRSLSAADLLKETMAAARPLSRQSKGSDRPKSERSGKSSRSRKQQKDEQLDLTPACLPNASPNEVVSDWLRSIPADSSMLALGDDPKEEEEEEEAVGEKAVEDVVKEEEEGPVEEKVEEEGQEEEVGKREEQEAGCEAAEEGEESADPAPGEGEGEGTPAEHPNTLLLSSDSMPRNWHSSAAVMKVLLRSSPGRCQSMPEVSPVYGRRLSTSARGLLDCLAQLQLIEPAFGPGCDPQKDRSQRYDDIITILQSLWLAEPANNEEKEGEQVSPPRSSSGVDMSTGSGGSGKENGLQAEDEVKSLHEEEAADKAVDETEGADAKDEDAHEETQAEFGETSPELAVPYIAEEEEEGVEEAPPSEEQSPVPQSVDSPKAADGPSSSDKSSAHDGSKSPTDNEDSSSGSPQTIVRAPLSNKLSQDPDPMWILHLLKKLEKQFMDHYINAMVDFKVRWDLDDSLMLDCMITELKEEVSRRIQSSVEREMRKIQSRAGRVGRGPRPPHHKNLSKESSMTEKRRQMLMIMKNQNPKTDTLSDGDTAGEFSDQRSEDEYCPCDACLRKKMAARPPPPPQNPDPAEAPVSMEFDLLKILQLKKGPPKPSAAQAPSPKPPAEARESPVEALSIEAMQEEDEQTKDSIKAYIVIDETIPEEDEEDAAEGEDKEEEEEEDGSETSDKNAEEEDGAECQCQCAEGQGQVTTEGETGDEEEETENLQGEEGEECQCAENGAEIEETEGGEAGEEAEETGDNAGEGEGKEAEDEGEHGGSEEQEEAQCAVCDCKTEEEGEGAKEESTPAGESAEGNEEEEEEEGEKHEDQEAEGGSEEQGAAASEEDGASPQGPGPAEGEGEEADGPAQEGETGEQDGGEEEAAEDAVQELKKGEGTEEDRAKKDESGPLLHQFTRTSVESQPGSLEDIDTHPPPTPNKIVEFPKLSTGGSNGGGGAQRRSRSPARVKRRKPKDSDVEVEDY